MVSTFDRTANPGLHAMTVIKGDIAIAVPNEYYRIFNDLKQKPRLKSRGTIA
jgi:hypothetical protein